MKQLGWDLWRFDALRTIGHHIALPLPVSEDLRLGRFVIHNEIPSRLFSRIGKQPNAAGGCGTGGVRIYT